jgi:hypothetical protein
MLQTVSHRAPPVHRARVSPTNMISNDLKTALGMMKSDLDRPYRESDAYAYDRVLG